MRLSLRGMSWKNVNPTDNHLLKAVHERHPEYLHGKTELEKVLYFEYLKPLSQPAGRYGCWLTGNSSRMVTESPTTTPEAKQCLQSLRTVVLEPLEWLALTLSRG